MGWNWRRSLVLAAAYELVEQPIERSPAGQKLFRVSRPETLPNSCVDMAVFAAGHELGRRWNATGEPAQD